MDEIKGNTIPKQLMVIPKENFEGFKKWNGH